MYYYTSQEFENYNKIFANSVDLRVTLLKEGISMSPKKVKELAENLLYNKDVIDQYTIEEIVKNTELQDVRTGLPLRKVVADILGRKFIKEFIYKAVIFTFKYSAVKNFFYGQYRKLLPEYDYDMINSSEKQKIFFEATMKELDRIDDAISAMADAFNVDQIPYKYLEYIADLIGYNSEDKNLVKDYVFRDLIKNMIEVYRVKGTNYSFELFLNFLGFDVTIKEYWFDRRFYYKKKGSPNEYTKATEKFKNSSIYYLTTENPENYIPKNLYKNEIVFKNEIKGTMDLNMFNRYLSNMDKYGYTLEQLLGYEPGFKDPYTFFKTNVVDFDFSSFKESSSQEVSTDDIKIINRIFEFLLPIFIKKQYLVTINDWYENVNPDKDQNENWAQSIFLFSDKIKRDQNINIDYEEVLHYDPIYDTTKRWDQDEVYYKGATVLYDISIDFREMEEVSYGDIVLYNKVYYVYVGTSGFMMKTPDKDPDNYMVYDYSSIVEWYKNMPITKNQIVRYTYEEIENPDYEEEGEEPIITYITSDFMYRGRKNKSSIPPNEDDFWFDLEIVLPEYMPKYYMTIKDQDIFNKYDYFIDGNHLYMSTSNYNKYTVKRFDVWDSYIVEQINPFVYGIPPQSGDVYSYNDHYYYYNGVDYEQQWVAPPENKNFILLTEKSYYKNTPDISPECWKEVFVDEDWKDFSVIDRIMFEDDITEIEAEKKINKLFDHVCVTSRTEAEARAFYKDRFNLPDIVDTVSTYEDLVNYDTSTLIGGDIIKVLEDENRDDKRSYYKFNKTDNPSNIWELDSTLSFEGKYIYLDFSNNTNYVEGADGVYYVLYEPGTELIVHNNQVVKYKNNYFYCYKEKTLDFDSETAADNYFNDILSNNNDPNIADIIDNYATTNYPGEDLDMYVPITYKAIRIDFDSDDFDDICDTIKQELINYDIIKDDEDPTAEEKDFVFEVIDDPNGKYFRIHSNTNKEFENVYDTIRDIIKSNQASAPEEDYDFIIEDDLNKVYFKINLRTNESFENTYSAVKQELIDHNIIKDDEDPDAEEKDFIFEKVEDPEDPDENYFKICSNPKKRTPRCTPPYIRISFDFIKTPFETISQRGEHITGFDYPWDKNNAFCLFKEYNIAPNKRYDFVNAAYPNSLYDFVNTKNYISEMYRSNKFILNKIPRRDVFSSWFEKDFKTTTNFNERDNFVEQKEFPKLYQNFSMDQISQVCFTDYYKNIYFETKINSIGTDPNTGENVIILRKEDIHQSVVPGMQGFIYIVYKEIDGEDTIIKSVTSEIEIESSEIFEDNNKKFVRMKIDNPTLLDNFSFGTMIIYPDYYYTFTQVDTEPSSSTIFLNVVDVGEQPFVPKPTPDYVVNTRKDLVAYDPAFLETGDIFEVKSDETFFGKTTYYEWVVDEQGINHWHEILPTRLYIELDYGDYNYQIECMPISSEVPPEGGRNRITIDVPNILYGIVSGRLRVLKTPWKLSDYYDLMGEYLTAGKSTYNYLGYDDNNPNNKNLTFNGAASY